MISPHFKCVVNSCELSSVSRWKGAQDGLNLSLTKHSFLCSVSVWQESYTCFGVLKLTVNSREDEIMSDRFVVALDGDVRDLVNNCKERCRAKTMAGVVRLAVSLLHKALNEELYSKGSDGALQKIVVI